MLRLPKISGLSVLSYQLKLMAARLKKGTAQRFRVSNLARIFINLSWYDISCILRRYYY